MVELICLTCGRTNPADAKFCSHCGAALLRRFCEKCRAVNDAEARFCHACGAALPEQLVPATEPLPGRLGEETQAPWPDVRIPTLNQVMAPDELGAATLQPLPGPGLDDSAENREEAVPQAARPSYRNVLFAVGAVMVLLLVAALWWRAPRTDLRPREADTSSTRGGASANVTAPPPAPTPALPTEPTSAPPNDRSEGSAAGSSEGAKSGESAAEAAPAPFEKPRSATAPRSAAGPTRPVRGTANPAPAPAPTPTPECTPQADALGLCAPGATITGR